MEDVLREVGVGLGDEDAHGTGSGGSGVKTDSTDKVFLHCTVGGVLGEKKVEQGDEADVSHSTIPITWP